MKRFRRMHKGYRRLFVGLYLLLIPVVEIIGQANGAIGYNDTGIGAIFTAIIYWPVIRLCLWIYDGFVDETRERNAKVPTIIPTQKSGDSEKEAKEVA